MERSAQYASRPSAGFPWLWVEVPGGVGRYLAEGLLLCCPARVGGRSSYFQVSRRPIWS